MTVHSKNKGNRFERAVAELLRICGYEAATARAQDRALDNLGVDLVTNAPFDIQCKHTERAPNFHALLDSMPERKGKRRVVFHKRNGRGVVVVMTSRDFTELLLAEPNAELDGVKL